VQNRNIGLVTQLLKDCLLSAAVVHSHTIGLLVFVLHNDAFSVSEYMLFRLGPQNGCERSAGAVKG